MAFHRIFPFYGNLYIPKHWELHGFSSTLNLRGSEEHGKSLCFPILFLCYVNSSHILGIVWTSASPKIFKEPKNLKFLCFPILFLYYGNPRFLCFWNCMDFCVRNHNFQMFVFSHTFPILWELTFYMFWELHEKWLIPLKRSLTYLEIGMVPEK